MFRAFPGQLNVRSSCDIPPPLTSTPIATKTTSNHLSTSETSTVVKVQYPSKTLNKSLTGNYQAIGKALAHGMPSQIANAVLKDPTLRKHVVEKTLKTLSKEVSDLCSKKNPSLLRKSTKDDLINFDLQNLCNEWQELAPLFYLFLMTSAVKKKDQTLLLVFKRSPSRFGTLKAKEGEDGCNCLDDWCASLVEINWGKLHYILY